MLDDMSELKITKTITISGIPYLGDINIYPSTETTSGIQIFVGSTVMTVEQLHEIRTAVELAIENAESMIAPANLPLKPVRLYMPGQELSGDEDLPIGTVVTDGNKDAWTLRPNGGWTCTGADSGRWALDQIIEVYGPTTIVSLPGGES
jgi:hypothetical protein